MQDFWTGFEKRAGVFDWLRKAPAAAEAAASKPGFRETIKNVVGDVADIAGQIKSHVTSEEAKKVMSNAASITSDLKGTASDIKKTTKALHWPLMALVASVPIGTIAGLPGKLKDNKLKDEQLKYYRSMNEQMKK